MHNSIIIQCLAYKSPLNANESITRLAWNGNVIVDGVWIRQLRISSTNCTNFGKIAQVRALSLSVWPWHYLQPNSSFIRRRCRVFQLGIQALKKSFTRNYHEFPPGTAAQPTTKPSAANTNTFLLKKATSPPTVEVWIDIMVVGLWRNWMIQTPSVITFSFSATTGG